MPRALRVLNSGTVPENYKLQYRTMSPQTANNREIHSIMKWNPRNAKMSNTIPPPPRYTLRVRPINSRTPPKKPRRPKHFPLLKLPNELVLLIAENIDDVKDLHSLILTNRYLARFLQDRDLLQRFALIEDKQLPYESKLIWASYEGYTPLVKRLLRGRSDVTNYVNIETLSKWTALTIATRSGHEEIVQLLLQNGASVSVKCQLWGKTALHHAVVSTQGTARIVQLLLEFGADPNIGDRRGCPPIHNALLWRAIDNMPNVATTMVKLILDNGGDISATHCGRPALHYAAHVGNESAITLLLDYGADITIADTDRKTALEWGDKGDSEDRSGIMRILLERWPRELPLPKLTPKYERLARAIQRDMRRM